MVYVQQQVQTVTIGVRITLHLAYSATEYCSNATDLATIAGTTGGNTSTTGL